MTITYERFAGLILALFGILSAVAYTRARSVDQMIKASIVLFGWLVLAIGFTLWSMFEVPHYANAITWNATNFVGMAIAGILAVAVGFMFAAQSRVPLRRFALRLLWTSGALLVLHAALIIVTKISTGDGDYVKVFIADLRQ